MKSKSANFNIAIVSLFGAIIIVMALVPFLGYIPLGFMNATLLHVPVIIASIVLGPKYGAILGFVFGSYQFGTKYGFSKPDVLCVFPVLCTGQLAKRLFVLSPEFWWALFLIMCTSFLQSTSKRRGKWFLWLWRGLQVP